MDTDIHAILDKDNNRLVYLVNDKQPTIYQWSDSLKFLTRKEFDTWLRQQKARQKHGNTHPRTSTKN